MASKLCETWLEWNPKTLNSLPVGQVYADDDMCGRLGSRLFGNPDRDLTASGNNWIFFCFEGYVWYIEGQLRIDFNTGLPSCNLPHPLEI